MAHLPSATCGCPPCRSHFGSRKRDPELRTKSVVLTQQLDRELADLSVDTGLTQSELVRHALRLYIDAARENLSVIAEAAKRYKQRGDK